MTHFRDMNLPTPLLKALDRLKFTEPTPIQLQTIPESLQGKDILGSAQTGTGKTLAFVVPLIAHLLKNPQAMSLILTPTRELAQQVSQIMMQLIKTDTNLRMALLIGGESIGKQFHQLRMNPRIIVGTPGRVIDHMTRNTLKKTAISFLVLDETDRMFDMGFGIQLNQIISQLPQQRQTLMFSATFPPKIEELAAKYMVTPHRVFVDEVIAISDKLKQETLFIKESDKYNELLTQLNSREGSIIVFVKTKLNADRLATQLTKADHSVSAIHGDLRQHKRERVMKAFRQGSYRIMVATDIAARGLDVPQIQHVINYDLPQASEDYIHRIGRTARNGSDGSALTFVSTKDRKLWDDIQRLMNPELKNSEKRFSNSRPSFNPNANLNTPRSRKNKFGSTTPNHREERGKKSYFSDKKGKRPDSTQSRTKTTRWA
jgi:superfamily II DNA/RNA helicase